MTDFSPAGTPALDEGIGPGDYRARLYERYASTELAHRDLSPAAVRAEGRSILHRIRRFLPQDTSASILELGCGYGALLLALQEAGYRSARGVDVSPEQVALASGLGVSAVTRADALAALETAAAPFDCIVAIDLLEHIPRRAVLPLLDAVAATLRPGGRLVLQTPNAESPFFGRMRYRDFTHDFALTPMSARQLVTAAGLRPLAVVGTDPIVHGPTSLLRALAWRAIKGMLWLYLAAETGVTRGHLFTQNMIVVAEKRA